MAITIANNMISLPRMLLISGNGRNVGKTFLACEFIRKFSEKNGVTGVKISPHFHDTGNLPVKFKTEDFIILEENQLNKKDSSRMLQAGAKKVYFVLARQEHLKEAFSVLIEILPEGPVVCESGGLRELVIPGVFLFVKKKGDAIVKKHLLAYKPEIVNFNGNDFDFDINRIHFDGKGFSAINN